MTMSKNYDVIVQIVQYHVIQVENIILYPYDLKMRGSTSDRIPPWRQVGV